jgi:hypothetical protein
MLLDRVHSRDECHVHCTSQKAQLAIVDPNTQRIDSGEQIRDFNENEELFPRQT